MTEQPNITYLVNEFGEPIAAFAPGECPELVTRDMIADAMNKQGGEGEGTFWADENPEPFTPATFHITHLNPKGDDLDSEADTWFCKPSAPGAYIVTGVKF